VVVVDFALDFTLEAVDFFLVDSATGVNVDEAAAVAVLLGVVLLGVPLEAVPLEAASADLVAISPPTPRNIPAARPPEMTRCHVEVGWRWP